jgi:translation initiation factor eIF-2B subunit delta
LPSKRYLILLANMERGPLTDAVQIIKSYETPKGTCLSRHFTSHILNRQIEYLTSCRPLCVAMGNTIRWLKLQVAEIDVEQSDESAKEQLCAAIDQFILQRIVISNKSVIQQGARRVEDGDSILVFGGHTLVQDTLLAARREGKKFEVIIVDDVFDSTGVAITKSLRQAGIPVMYCPDMALGCIQACRTTKTFVAAEAVFEDGSVYARAGSADIACATVAAQNSLLVLCQSLNISDKMPTDSLTYNEMDPDRASNAGGVRLLYDVIKPAETVIIILEDSGVTPHLITEKFKKLDFL